MNLFKWFCTSKALKPKANGSCAKAHGRIAKAKKQGHKASAAYYALQSHKVSSALQNRPNFLKLNCVAYADDLLIKPIGPFKHATIKQLMQCFLKNRLTLSLTEQKTLITPAKGNTINLVGFKIQH